MLILFKFIVTSFLLVGLFHNVAFAMQAPVINFSDLTAAPRSGWSASEPNKGAAVTIWGREFGTTRGNSYVTVNGVKLTSNQDYAEPWGESGKPVQFLQRISFWLKNTMPTGLGQITVTVNGKTSDPIPFRIGGGDIYFVDVNANAPGSGSLPNPWQDLSDFIDVMQPGDIAYFRQGVYDQRYNGGKSNIWVRGSETSGTATQPIAFVAYPGEHPLFDAYTNSSASNFNRSVQIDASHITVSKLSTIALGSGVKAGEHTRVVGNDLVGVQQYFSGTGIITTDSDAAKILGNATHGGRSGSRFDHSIYLSGCSPNKGVEVAFNHSYDNSFDRGPHIVVNHQQNRCESNQQLKSHFIHHNLVDCSSNQSRGIGVYDLSWDAGEANQPEPTYVYNNIVNACGRLGGYGSMYHNNGHAVFYNNTVYDSQGPSLAVSGSSVLSTTAVNNMFIQRNSSSDYVDATITLESNNHYFGGDNGGISTAAANRVFGDPRLTINFQSFEFTLAPNSPAVGRGSTVVSSIVKDDFVSTKRSPATGFDIGAIQSLQQPSLPPGSGFFPPAILYLLLGSQ